MRKTIRANRIESPINSSTEGSLNVGDKVIYQGPEVKGFKRGEIYVVTNLCSNVYTPGKERERPDDVDDRYAYQYRDSEGTSGSGIEIGNSIDDKWSMVVDYKDVTPVVSSSIRSTRKTIRANRGTPNDLLNALDAKIDELQNGEVQSSRKVIRPKTITSEEIVDFDESDTFGPYNVDDIEDYVPNASAEELNEYRDNDIETVQDYEELQDMIWACPDGVLEDQLQQMYSQCEEDGDDIDTCISLLSNIIDEFISMEIKGAEDVPISKPKNKVVNATSGTPDQLMNAIENRIDELQGNEVGSSVKTEREPIEGMSMTNDYKKFWGQVCDTVVEDLQNENYFASYKIKYPMVQIDVFESPSEKSILTTFRTFADMSTDLNTDSVDDAAMKVLSKIHKQLKSDVEGAVGDEVNSGPQTVEDLISLASQHNLEYDFDDGGNLIVWDTDFDPGSDDPVNGDHGLTQNIQNFFDAASENSSFTYEDYDGEYGVGFKGIRGVTNILASDDLEQFRDYMNELAEIIEEELYDSGYKARADVQDQKDTVVIVVDVFSGGMGSESGKPLNTYKISDVNLSGGNVDVESEGIKIANQIVNELGGIEYMDPTPDEDVDSSFDISTVSRKSIKASLAGIDIDPKLASEIRSLGPVELIQFLERALTQDQFDAFIGRLKSGINSSTILAADAIDDVEYLNKLSASTQLLLGEQGYAASVYLSDNYIMVDIDENENSSAIISAYVQPIEDIEPNWDDLDSDAQTLADAVVTSISTRDNIESATSTDDYDYPPAQYQDDDKVVRYKGFEAVSSYEAGTEGMESDTFGFGIMDSNGDSINLDGIAYDESGDYLLDIFNEGDVKGLIDRLISEGYQLDEDYDMGRDHYGYNE